jgi:hypothetical protein
MKNIETKMKNIMMIVNQMIKTKDILRSANKNKNKLTKIIAKMTAKIKNEKNLCKIIHDIFLFFYIL